MTTHKVTTEVLDSLVSALNERAVREEWGTKLSTPKHTYQIGKRYARIVQDHAAYCFIELSTGNIKKSASWKSPSPQNRGNIFTPTLGMEFLTRSGAHYLYR